MQHALARLALTGLGMLSVLANPAQERSPGVKRLTFVLEVDHALAREQGWVLESSSDAQVVEAAAAIVKRRFEALARAVRLNVQAEKGQIEIGLPSIDQRDRELFEGLLRGLGVCEFFFVADEASTRGLDIDLALERQKLEAWRRENPALPLEAFNALEPAQQGPHRRLSWIAVDRSWPKASDQPSLPLLLPDTAEDLIGAACFERSYVSVDELGYPAIGFELRSSRTDDFARITEAHVKQSLAIVVAGKLVSAPTLESKLIGGGLIEGRFTEKETMRWIEAFQKLQGPLRVVEIR